MRVAEYEVVDHGVDHESYFPGCGTAFTNFDQCYTGIGYSGAEALDDALESAAQVGWEWTDPQENTMFTYVSHRTDEVFLEEEPAPEDMWHYVSIRLKGE